MVKIKVPQKVKIGSFDYHVGFTEYMKSDENWRAACNQRTGRIAIDPTCGDTRKRSYLHEVVHMIDLNYGVGLNEENIDRMANGIAEYLFNNLNIEFDWSSIKE